MSEDDILRQIIYWADHKRDIGPYIFHFANERVCSPASGRNLKLKGVRPGVADLFYAVPRGGHPGLWIELKTSIGKLIPSQFNFLSAMDKCGYATAICRSFEQTMQTIEKYVALGHCEKLDTTYLDDVSPRNFH